MTQVPEEKEKDNKDKEVSKEIRSAKKTIATPAIDKELYSTRLDDLTRHIRHVQESCQLLAKRILNRGKDGDLDLAHDLVASAAIHDASKFKGIEWMYLHDEIKDTDPDLFKAAHIQHVTTNPHHPEFWSDGIQGMPLVYLAEFVCDTFARSSEFGTDYREWIKKTASQKYGYTLNSRVYKDIKSFMDLLLDKAF